MSTFESVMFVLMLLTAATHMVAFVLAAVRRSARLYRTALALAAVTAVNVAATTHWIAVLIWTAICANAAWRWHQERRRAVSDV